MIVMTGRNYLSDNDRKENYFHLMTIDGENYFLTLIMMTDSDITINEIKG
jgi:hypothetical protein